MKRVFFIFILLLLSDLLYCQIDTMAFVKISVEKPCYKKNGFIEYISYEMIDTVYKEITKTKIWYVNNPKINQLSKINAEIKTLRSDSSFNIIIFDGKQCLYMNKTLKSCFLYTFSKKLSSDDKDKINHLRLNYLPSFMNSNQEKKAKMKGFHDWIKNKETCFYFLNDTLLNGMKCFGAKIIDTTIHISYMNDEAAPGEELYSIRSEDIIYFNKEDSVLVYRKSNIVYPAPYYTISTVEQIIKYSFNNVENLDNKHYAIKTDTLKDYFLTYEKIMNNKKISVVRNIPFKKAPDIRGVNYMGETFTLYNVKAKLILLDFWGKFCGACLTQMDEFKKYYKDLKQMGLETFGINSSDSVSEKMISFLKERNYAHPLIYSKAASNMYRLTVYPVYFLIDENYNIIESFYQLDELKINEIKQRLLKLSKPIKTNDK